MGYRTGIPYSEHTFTNLWGCTFAGEDCINCYAKTLAERFGWDIWGPNAKRRTFGEHHWKEPESWNREGEREGRPHLVFCSSMGDVFEDHPTVAKEREGLWLLIRRTPWLFWQIFTKRPERIAECLPPDWGEGYPNVWLGTSVGFQKYVDKRVSALLTAPAIVRFLSVEPLLEAVDVSKYLGADRINWVIVGGESGPAFRPMETRWATDLRDQCDAAKVPFFFKQSAGLRPETGIELEGEIRRDFPAFVPEATARAAMESKNIKKTQNMVSTLNMRETRNMKRTRNRAQGVARRTSRAITVRVSDVELKKVRWLWKGYIPLGKITLLEGDPDKGKSMVAVDIAARVTTGRAFPPDWAACTAAGVVILSGEDDPEDTIRPRLEAAGADTSRVMLLKGVKASSGLAVSPTLSDLDALEETVSRVGAKLVIVDTLPDFFGSGSLLDPQAVRRVLAPLAVLATRLGFAVILVRHFTKTGRTIMAKGAGSTAIAAVSRSGLFIVKDPDNDSRRVLACFKHNVTPEEPAALVFRLVTVNDVGQVKWVRRTPWTAEALLAASLENETAKGARREAESFLRLFLQDGPHPAKEVMEAGEAEGHAKRTLQRARKRLGIVAERRGGLGKSGEWYLRLPKTANTVSPGVKTSKNAKDRQSKSGGLRTPPLPAIDTRPRLLLLPLT